MIAEDNELLELRWTEYPDSDIITKRFKRMGALLEWVEHNAKNKLFMLKVVKK